MSERLRVQVEPTVEPNDATELDLDVTSRPLGLDR